MGGKTGRAAKAGAKDWWGVKLLSRFHGCSQRMAGVIPSLR